MGASGGPGHGGRSNGWAPVARAAAVALAAAALALVADEVRITRPLPSSSLRPEQGRAFYVRVSGAGRSDAEGLQSTLEVLEDGRPLPFPHALHDDVRTEGRGRYSHWFNGVLLSTSDDSDPRTNGRTYTLRHSLDPTPLLALLPLVLLLDRSWWRERLRRAASRPAATTAVLIGVAVLVRTLAFALEADGTIQGCLVKGVPYSDARSWEALATRFSEGDFEWIASCGWTARRPLYWLVLGAVYGLTGASVAVAQVLNLVFGALAVGFVFDALRRVVPLPVAALAALLAAATRCHVEGQLLTMSEPLGELCTAVSVWALVLGVAPTGGVAAAPRLGWLCVAGAFLGLSNLARPLTLLAGGALPVVLLVAPRGWSPRARVAAGAALVLGVVLTLGPWIAVQRVRHGISTMSENTAEMLFAATSRAHDGAWGPGISRLGPTRPLAERVRFYMDGTRENLREDLGWYVGRTALNLLGGIYRAAPHDLAMRVALCVAFVALVGPVPRRGRAAVAMVIALLTPGWVLWPLGALWALAARGPMALLATYHLATWVSMALVSVSFDHRFTHALEWTALALSGWTIWRLLEVAAGAPATTSAAPGWERGKGLLRAAVALGGVALAAGVTLALAARPAARPAPMEPGERARWIERAVGQEAQEGYRALAPRLQVIAARLRRDYRVDLGPEDAGVWGDVVTRARPYPVVLLLDGDGLNAVFPGAAPPLPEDADVVLVGVGALEGVPPNEQSILEVVAIGLPDGRVVYPDPASVPAHVAHITSVLR
jgi:hypothetical protein